MSKKVEQKTNAYESDYERNTRNSDPNLEIIEIFKGEQHKILFHQPFQKLKKPLSCLALLLISAKTGYIFNSLKI